MAAGAAGAAAAAFAQAVKSSGVLVHVEPREFTRILGKVQEPLVVTTRAGFITKYHHYLVSYKGLAFYTRSLEPVELPAETQVVPAKNMWVPG
jgi:hypothetical protein